MIPPWRRNLGVIWRSWISGVGQTRRIVADANLIKTTGYKFRTPKPTIQVYLSNYVLMFWRCLTCQWLAIQVAIAVCGACGNFFHQDTVVIDFGDRVAFCTFLIHCHNMSQSWSLPCRARRPGNWNSCRTDVALTVAPRTQLRVRSPRCLRLRLL